MTEERKQQKREALQRFRSSEKGREATRAYSRANIARRRAERPVEYWSYNLRKRAEDRGLDHDLTPEWIAAKLAPMRCERTGLPLQHTAECDAGAKGKMSPWAPSFDRRDSSKGYTQDNVELVCWAFNVAKGPWDFEVFEAVARGYMEQHNAR